MLAKEAFVLRGVFRRDVAAPGASKPDDYEFIRQKADAMKEYIREVLVYARKDQ